MKNSKKYSKKIHWLYRSLKSQHPNITVVNYEKVEDALVYAAISENMSESAAEAAIKRFGEYFVDLNDLRVSQEKEIMEQLGEDTSITMDTASRLIRVLRAIFDQYNKVSLEALRNIGKRPAKQILEKLEGTSPFVVNFCMLTSLLGHAIPLTKKMIEYLRANELVHPEADEREIEGFLTKRIPAANAYEFYALLRRESELPKLEQTKEAACETRKRKKK